MKNLKTHWILSLCLIVFTASLSFAQENIDEKNSSELKVKKRTLMERFAPEYVTPVEERIAMKVDRKEEVKRNLAILDTMQISDRKKRKLMRDIKYSPFSDRLQKAVITNTSFEDVED